MNRASGAFVPFSVLPVGDPDLVGAYPVAGFGVTDDVLMVGAGSLVPFASERSRLGMLAAKAGASFGPQDHLTAARLLVAERAAETRDEEMRVILKQVGLLLDALQRASRDGDATQTQRLTLGVASTLTNLAPPTHMLARRGILPRPRDFVLFIERIGAHVGAFARSTHRPSR
jgi:hypothetical protein